MHKSATETIFSKGWVPHLLGFSSSPLYDATTIERLTAERDELVAWFDGLTPNEMHASIVKLRERALAAEFLNARQAEALKEIESDAQHGVNSPSEALSRIFDRAALATESSNG